MLQVVIFSALIPLGLAQRCGQNYNLFSDRAIRIASPGFPAKYTAGDDCIWTFYSKDVLRISFTCSPFNLGGFGRGNCLSDYVKVNNKIFCGDDVISEKFDTNHFDLLFKRQIWETSEGFRGFECVITSLPIKRMTKMKYLPPGLDFKTVKPSVSYNENYNDCPCNSTGNNVRIVGGSPTRVIHYPFQASLRMYRTRVFCGASLVSSQFVLTAAHCVKWKSKDTFEVTLGNSNLKNPDGTTVSLSVSEIIVHEGYKPENLSNDIALIKLNQPVRFSDAVQPLCLPFGGRSDDIDDKVVLVTGWGTTKFNGIQPNVLQVVELIGVPWNECYSRYFNSTLNSDMVCAYAAGKDACQGDSGGPLLLENDGNFYQYGIVSFGISCASRYPGVYTNVVNYLDWISSKVDDVCLQ